VRVLLIVRTVACAFFAWRLSASTPPSAPDLAEVFSRFALTDGLLAFALAVFIWTSGWHKGIAGLAALDAVMRLVAYRALAFAPGIPEFAVTLVLFAVMVAVFAFFWGVLDILEANRLHRETGSHGLGVVLCIAGVGAMALATGEFFVTPSLARYRELLSAGALLQALAMLAVVMLTGQKRGLQYALT